MPDRVRSGGADRIEGVSSQESKNIWKGWSPQLQVNYMVNVVNERSAQRDAGLSQNHSFGTFYKYDRHPSGEYSSMFYTDSYENALFKERSESNSKCPNLGPKISTSSV